MPDYTYKFGVIRRLLAVTIIIHSILYYYLCTIILFCVYYVCERCALV